MFASSLFFLLLVATGSERAATNEELFRQGNEWFKAKEYDKAIDAYVQTINQGWESASLYYNLGNAYFKKGELGLAIVNYLRARRLAPGDPDIRNNLTFARSFTRVRMEGVKLNPIKSFMENLVAPYRLNTLAWISSGVFMLFLALLSMRFGLGMRQSAVRFGISTAVILLLAGLLLTTVKYRHDYLVPRAVLTAEDCPVYTGPTDASDLEFEGSPGLVVEIVAESGNYYNVQFENNRRGWVRKSLVAVV